MIVKGVTKKSILEALGYYAEEMIYKAYLSIDPKVGVRYNNPFIGSDNKTFKFFIYQGKLIYQDKSPNRSQYTGDCFKAVMQKTGLSYKDSLVDIDKRFNLGLTRHSNKTYKKLENKSYIPKREQPSAKIEVVIQDYTRKDYEYFKEYGIDPSILPKLDVYSCKVAVLNGNIWLTYSNHRPLYAFKFKDKYKIYSPYNRSGKKWLGNVKGHQLSGMQILPDEGDKLVVTSSVKDGLIFSTHGYNQIGPQGEGIIPNNLEPIFSRFKQVYIWLDCDSAGKTATTKWCQKYSHVKNLIPVIWDSKHKDISDFSKHEGKEKTKELIINYIGKSQSHADKILVIK